MFNLRCSNTVVKRRSLVLYGPLPFLSLCLFTTTSFPVSVELGSRTSIARLMGGRSLLLRAQSSWVVHPPQEVPRYIANSLVSHGEKPLGVSPSPRRLCPGLRVVFTRVRPSGVL